MTCSCARAGTREEQAPCWFSSLPLDFNNDAWNSKWARPPKQRPFRSSGSGWSVHKPSVCDTVQSCLPSQRCWKYGSDRRECVHVAGDDSLITESVLKVSLDFRSQRQTPTSPSRDKVTQIVLHPHRKKAAHYDKQHGTMALKYLLFFFIGQQHIINLPGGSADSMVYGDSCWNRMFCSFTRCCNITKHKAKQRKKKSETNKHKKTAKVPNQHSSHQNSKKARKKEGRFRVEWKREPSFF